MKVTEFLNAFAAEGGQAGDDFPKMKLFRKEKCLGNQFRIVSQLEIFKRIIYRSPIS